MKPEFKKFPIGFWNYTPTGYLGPEAVKDWADLGMTMAGSPEFGEGDDKETMLSILDACEEQGIRVIVFDERARWMGVNDDREAYKARFQAALDDFGHHPAVLGFHVGDEPTTDKTFQDAADAHRLQLETAPDLIPHLNFIPYWEGQEKTMLHAPTFEDWAVDFAKKSDLKILCYDCYTQMNPGEEGFGMYFGNLRHFMSAAKAADLIPWTTLLSVGHFRYRVPNEDDLRWQLNTAVASGMKGILWFFVYERVPTANYRLPPIDEFGERTETFTRMSRVNRHFLHQFGDFFLRAEHKATFHIEKSYGGYPLFEAGKSDDILYNVTSDQGVPGIVSIFELDGRKHIAVVNNSTTDSGMFRLHVPKGTKTFARFSWDHEYFSVEKQRWDAHYSETDTECIGGDWLAPGQMKVYLLEK